VRKVIIKGPAFNSGIKAGDIITHFNGYPLKNHSALQIKTGLSKIGEIIKITVFRNKKPWIFKITMEKMPTRRYSIKKHTHFFHVSALKIFIITLSNIIQNKPKFQKNLNRLQIIDLKYKKNTIKYDLKKNDIIIAINNIAIFHMKDIDVILKNIVTGETIRLLIQRNSIKIFVNVIK